VNFAGIQTNLALAVVLTVTGTVQASRPLHTHRTHCAARAASLSLRVRVTVTRRRVSCIPGGSSFVVIINGKLNLTASGEMQGCHQDAIANRKTLHRAAKLM
jgi:hypothetical protein